MTKAIRTKEQLGNERWKPASITSGDNLKRALEMYHPTVIAYQMIQVYRMLVQREHDE